MRPLRLRPGGLLVRGHVRERPEGAGSPAGGRWTCTTAGRCGTWNGCLDYAAPGGRALASSCPRPAGRAWRRPIPLARQEVLRTLAIAGEHPPPRTDRAARAADRADGPLLRRPPRRVGGPAPVARASAAKIPPSLPAGARRWTARSGCGSPSCGRKAPCGSTSSSSISSSFASPNCWCDIGIVIAENGAAARVGVDLGSASGIVGSRRLSELRPADNGVPIRSTVAAGMPAVPPGPGLLMKSCGGLHSMSPKGGSGRILLAVRDRVIMLVARGVVTAV